MRSAAAAILFFGAAALGADQSVTIGPAIAFMPSTVTVAPGDKVTWTWAGAPHSTTSDSTTGPEVWDSGIVSTIGTNFSHTFTTPGTYPYYCKVHSFPGGSAMNGVVQVVAATATPTPNVTATPTPTPTPVGATPSPSPTGAIAPGAAVPLLGWPATVALLLGLGLGGVLVLSLASRR